MSVEENKAIVRRAMEESPGNIDLLDKVVAPDAAFGGSRGLDAYKHVVSEWVTGFPDGKFVVEDVIAQGTKWLPAGPSQARMAANGRPASHRPTSR